MGFDKMAVARRIAAIMLVARGSIDMSAMVRTAFAHLQDKVIAVAYNPFQGWYGVYLSFADPHTGERRTVTVKVARPMLQERTPSAAA